MNTQKISFGFTKKIEKKNLQESINKKGFLYSAEKQEGNTVSKINDIRDIIRNKKLKEEKVCSIPALKNTRTDIFQKHSKKGFQNNVETSAQPLTLDEMAVKQLCEESLQKSNDFKETRSTITSIPVGQLPKDEVGVIPSLNDYEEIAVNSFGEAILHGLGWMKGQGLGKNTKAFEMVDPTNLTFGLTSKEVSSNVQEEEEEFILKQGSNVLIIGGRNKGKYGTVQSLDIDHCLVKLVRDDQSVVRVIEQHIKTVNNKEFKNFSRVINKEMYDKFKDAEDSSNITKLCDNSKNNNNQSHEEKDNENIKRIERKDDSRDHEMTKYKNSRSWLREGLRVKIVGKPFKKGHHYKEKVIIKSLDGKDRCSCLTEDNKLLNDLYAEDLETVIPRKSSSYVLIVKGSLKGEKGIIIKNDKERQEVKVEIQMKSVRKGYDDVCEYVPL